MSLLQKQYLLSILVIFLPLTTFTQSDGFPVVNFPFKGAGLGLALPKLLVDEDENIYVVSIGTEGSQIDPPDTIGAIIYIDFAKYDNKGKLLWTRQKIELDYPYVNSSPFVPKGPRPRQVLMKDSLIHISGIIIGTRPGAWFSHTLNLDGNPIDTSFVTIEDGFSISLGDLFVGNETFLLLRLRETSQLNNSKVNLYKKTGKIYHLVRTYEGEDLIYASRIFFFSEDEFYSHSGLFRSPDMKYHIYKHNIEGDIIAHFEDDFSGRLNHIVGDTVFFYYEDYNVFHNDQFTGDKKYYDDYVPPMPAGNIDRPDIADFIRATDGSIMAVGDTYLGQDFVFSFMHRIAPDGNSEYAWIYDPQVVPLNSLSSIVEIKSGYVIAGTRLDQEYGYYMALIDKEGYLVSTTDHKVPDSRIQVLLYPNPCVDELFLEIEDIFEGRINIFDLQGRHIHQQKVSGPKTTILTSNLPPGMYILKWQSVKDHAWVSKKFLKME